MRIVVTGAGGTIGRAVVARLLAADVRVVALSLEPLALANVELPAAERANVGLGGVERAGGGLGRVERAGGGLGGVERVVVGSAGDIETVANAFADPVDAVIHLAAIPAPTLGSAVDVFAGNTRATFVVLDEAGRRGVPRAVIASSYALLGMPFAPRELHPAYFPLDEHTPPQVADPYALSKLVDEATAEMMHRRYGMAVAALRFPFTAGDERLAATAAQLRADPVDGARNSWAYLHVDDAAEAAWRAASMPLHGFHRLFLAAPETCSPEPTEALLARYHPGVPLRRPIPGRQVPIDTSPIEALLDFHPSRRLP